MGLFLRKNHPLRCWGWLSLLSWVGALTFSPLLKLSARKLEPWFVLWSFLLLSLFCISINLPYAYYAFAWNTVLAGVPSCYLELLDKLQKLINRTVGPSLATSLEPNAHRRNVASLSLFYRFYDGRCSSELAQLVRLSHSRGRSTYYSDRLHDFWVTIPRYYKDVYVNSFFSRTVRLCNYLPIDCYPLVYGLNGFKNWQTPINSMFFLKRFPLCFNLFVLLFLVTPWLAVAVQPCMEWIPVFKKYVMRPCNLLRFKLSPLGTLWQMCGTSTILNVFSVMSFLFDIRSGYSFWWSCYDLFFSQFVAFIFVAVADVFVIVHLTFQCLASTKWPYTI